MLVIYIEEIITEGKYYIIPQIPSFTRDDGMTRDVCPVLVQ